MAEAKLLVEKETKSKVIKIHKSVKRGIEIICECGETFYTDMYEIRNNNKRFCKQCSMKKSGLKRRMKYKDIKKYINDAETGNGCSLVTTEHEFNLLQEIKVPSSIRIEIECSCGEKFFKVVDKFKSGEKQCQKCGQKILTESMKFSLQEVKNFIESNSKSKLISTQYKNSKTSMLFMCQCSQVFETNFDTFKHGGKRNCNKCRDSMMRGLFVKNPEKFIKEVHSLVGDEYVVVGEYVNTNTKIDMYHKICTHTYSVTPAKFLAGRRCPICFESKGEQRIRYFLEARNISYVKEYEFDELTGVGGNPLRFDFAIFDQENYLTHLIEYDGEQHYDWFPSFMSLREFTNLQYHDNLKNNYCNEKHLTLIRIPFFEFENIEGILNNNIKFKSKIQQ